MNTNAIANDSQAAFFKCPRTCHQLQYITPDGKNNIYTFIITASTNCRY